MACVLFFGACALVLCWAAFSGDSSIEILFIELSQSASVVAYWVMGAASLAFVLFGFAELRALHGPERFLELTREDLKIPHGLLRMKLAKIRWDEITEISEKSTFGQTMLILKTVQGDHQIPQSLLPSRDAYRETKELIQSGLSELRKPG